MRIILNVIWLVLCGIWMAIAYALVGLLCFVLFFLVITIPFGIAAFRISGYVLWPFGRTIAPREDGMGVGAIIGNIIWVILFGWGLALAHLVTGVLLCVTIIGIPLGLANFKIIPISLMPLGVRIVPVDEPLPIYRSQLRISLSARAGQAATARRASRSRAGGTGRGSTRG